MEDENEKCRKSLEQAKGSFSLEGMEISKDQEELALKFIKGMTTEEELIEEAIKQARKKEY